MPLVKVCLTAARAVIEFGREQLCDERNNLNSCIER